MIKITTWSPDTCDCVIDYEWDDAVSENDRVHNFKAAIKRCPAHAALVGPEHFNTVMDENTRKNKVLGLAQKVVPELKPEHYSWSFDDKRVLQVDFVGLNATQKNLILNKCDADIGKEKVKIK